MKIKKQTKSEGNGIFSNILFILSVYKYKLLILSIRRQNIMMNRKKQRTIAVIICVILIISMLAGILLPYVVD